MKEELWLRTDELNEAIKTLDILKHFLDQVGTDLHFWKWCIIAMHNATQGFMVCALTGTNGLNVLKKKNAKKWLDALRNNTGDYPEAKMDFFLNLYEKTKGERMNLFVSSRSFTPQEQQEESIRKINELRNTYIHFTPKKWSLYIGGLPSVLLDCMTYIEFLAFESSNIIYMDEDTEQGLRANIDRIKKNLSVLDKQYVG